MRCAVAQRLEGSRFGVHIVPLATFAPTLVQPERAKTGGSREGPIGSQLDSSCLNQSESMGKFMALGYSREPPVATFFGPNGA